MGVGAIVLLVLLCVFPFPCLRESEKHESNVSGMQDDQFDTFDLVPPRTLLAPPIPITSNNEFDTFDFRISDSQNGMTRQHLHRARQYYDDSDDSRNGMGMGMVRQNRHQARRYYDDSDDSSGSSNSKNSM